MIATPAPTAVTGAAFAWSRKQSHNPDHRPDHGRRRRPDQRVGPIFQRASHRWHLLPLDAGARRWCRHDRCPCYVGDHGVLACAGPDPQWPLRTRDELRPNCHNNRAQPVGVGLPKQADRRWRARQQRAPHQPRPRSRSARSLLLHETSEVQPLGRQRCWSRTRAKTDVNGVQYDSYNDYFVPRAPSWLTARPHDSQNVPRKPTLRIILRSR